MISMLYTDFLLFMCSLNSTSRKDEEFINKLKDQECDEICYRKTNLPDEYYYISLYRGKSLLYKKNVQILKKGKVNYVDLHNEETFEKFIYFLGRSSKSNRCLVFESKNRKELFKLIRVLRNKLFDDKIEKINICYVENNRIKDFHSTFFNHVEAYNDKLIVIRKKSIGNCWYLERLRISNEYILLLLEDRFDLYFSFLDSPKEEILIRQYFFNHKLLLIDLDSKIKEGFILYKGLVDSENYQNISFKSLEFIRDLNILFYFLSSSGCVKYMIGKTLNFRELESSYLLRKILKDLNIHVFDGKDILSSLNMCLIPVEENINRYLATDIIDRIKMVDVRKDVKNYNNFLLYFYNFMKINDYLEIDELLKIVDLFFIKQDLKLKNEIIFKKLNRYIYLLHNQDTQGYIFDVHGYQEVMSLNSPTSQEI